MSQADAPDPLHALCLADPVWAERYEGWDELGHGGSATVVRTRSRASDAFVALKVFPRLDAEGRRRFQQEVRHNQLLASPFIVRTYSPFLRAGLSWIEMEWVDGPDLRHELERRARAGEPFEARQARRIGAALARALQAAHQAGVIHRDVKPANVLLPRDGRPLAKLGDFGISRVFGATRITATGLIAGTPHFVAPEVVGGRPADARSDVYSLALTVFLLCADNRFPYDLRADDPPASWLEAHARGRPRRLRDLAPEAGADLEALLERALAKDPDQRPDAATLGAALWDPADDLSASTPADRLAGSSAGRTRQRVGWRAPWGRPALVGLAAVVVLTSVRGLLRPRAGAGALPEPTRAPVAATPQATTTPPVSAPARSASPATPEPAEVGAKLTAALSGDAEARLLVLTNEGTRARPPFDVALVADDGRVSRARYAQPLAVGDELALALDAFTPAPPPHARFLRVEVQFKDGTRAKLTPSIAN